MVGIDPISIPALDQLSNVTIGTKLEDELRSLNSSLPDLDKIRDTLKGFVECVLLSVLLEFDHG